MQKISIVFCCFCHLIQSNLRIYFILISLIRVVLSYFCLKGSWLAFQERAIIALKRKVSVLFWSQIFFVLLFICFKYYSPESCSTDHGHHRNCFALHSSIILSPPGFSPAACLPGRAGCWSWLGRSVSILPQREAVRGWLFSDNLLLKKCIYWIKNILS